MKFAFSKYHHKNKEQDLLFQFKKILIIITPLNKIKKYLTKLSKINNNFRQKLMNKNKIKIIKNKIKIIKKIEITLSKSNTFNKNLITIIRFKKRSNLIQKIKFNLMRNQMNLIWILKKLKNEDYKGFSKDTKL